MKTTKKIVALFIAVLMVFSAVSVSLTAFAATKKVTKVTLNKTSATVFATKTVALTAKVTPSNASNKKITWSTSNKSVATVSSSGVVTGKKAGTATITAKAADGSGKKATCKITVKKFVKITSVSLNYTSKSVNVGSTLKLKATAKPSNASIVTYKWTSSNTKVATVNTTGTVKGVKAGTATITCAATDGSGKKATCKITVKNVPVSSITLNKTSITVYPTKSYTLKATVSPTNATNPAVKWTSSDTTAATVSSTGVVKGIKAGKTATITCAATDGSGKKATCKVTVGTYAKTITLTSDVDKDSSWYLNKTGKVTAAITPSNTTNKKVTWTSSEPECVTVDASGNVKVVATSKKVKNAFGITTTKKVTSAVITAAAADGSGVTGTYTVNIKDFVALKNITVAEKFPEVIFIGQTAPLKIATDPLDASERGVKFTSSNTKVATVDAKGNVKAIKEGTAVITATSTADSTKKVTVNVEVKPVTMKASITTSTKKDFYAVGGKATIVCYTEPSEALMKLGTKFESENPKVAKMVPYPDNPNLATIEFVGVGKTRVRALTENGGVASDWIDIEVREIRISKSYFENVKAGDCIEIEAYLYNGTRIPANDKGGEIEVSALGDYADYITVVPEEETGKFTILVDKELPDTGARITLKAVYDKANITATVSLNKGECVLPKYLTTEELLPIFKTKSLLAKTIEKADNVKTVNFSNVTVDNSKSKSEMTVNGMSLDLFIKTMGGIIGDDEGLMDEMSPEAMIMDLYGEPLEEFSTVGRKDFPNEITVDATDVKSITYIDNGGATYQMKLVLKDQTVAVALDNVKGSSYGKSMKVIDKAFMDDYAKKLDISEGAEGFGDDINANLNYGTINQKYTGGYIIYTIDKLTGMVIESEYHYKSDIKVDKAVFDMKASLAEGGLNLTLGVKLTAYFTMQVETTSTYTSMKY